MLPGRQKWTLTKDAFDKLLVAFGGDRETAGQKYLEIRQEKKVVQTATWSVSESRFAFFSGLNAAARVAFVAVAILLVAGAAWLFVETQRLRRQVTQLQAENQSLELERRRNEESLRQLTETTEANPPGIASLTLLPGVSRGGSQEPNLVLSNEAR